MKQRKAFIVFDLDGTLLDTPRGIVKTFAATLHELGHAIPPDDAIRATIGRPLVEVCGDFLGQPADSGAVSEAVNLYRLRFNEIVLPAATSLLFPGVAPGLVALHRRGIRLAVATNRSTQGAEDLLKASGIRDRFGCVVGFDGRFKPKPNPDSLDHIARQFSLPADVAWVVGDTTFDIEMAQARSATAIGVTYGVQSREVLQAARPHHLVDTFESVVDLFGATVES